MNTTFTLEHHVKPLWQYAQEKIELLQQDFCMELTANEIQHMMQLTNEVAVDQYAHTLIMTKL